MKSPVDIVYVLGTGSKWNDNEIRFSLRSLEKNLKGFRNVFIIGAKPTFLQNVIHIPATDVYDPAINADGNMTHKILLACAIPELSDNFLFMNDDFVVLKPVEASEIPWLHKGDMKDRPDGYWKTQHYRYRLKRTFDTLQERCKTTLQYDYHAPMLMNKHNFRSVMEQYDYAEGIGLTFRSIYGNAMKLPADRLTDQKKTVFVNRILPEITPMLESCTFLGYNDQGLNRALIYWLWKSFSEKSGYEANDIQDRTIDIATWLEGERNFKEGVKVFKKYLHGVNLLKMFEGGETPVMRKKLEYKLERTMDDLK